MITRYSSHLFILDTWQHCENTHTHTYFTFVSARWFIVQQPALHHRYYFTSPPSLYRHRHHYTITTTTTTSSLSYHHLPTTTTIIILPSPPLPPPSLDSIRSTPFHFFFISAEAPTINTTPTIITINEMIANTTTTADRSN